MRPKEHFTNQDGKEERGLWILRGDESLMWE